MSIYFKNTNQPRNGFNNYVWSWLNSNLTNFGKELSAYLPDTPGGGGIGGTNYVYVMADGTDVENAAELQAAYDTAVTKVVNTFIPSSNIAEGFPQNIYGGSNFFILNGGEYPSLGIQNVEVISNSGTSTISIDVINSDPFTVDFTYSGPDLIDVISFKYFITEIKRATVIAGPGYYNFSSDFIIDEEYVDLVSLDGNQSIIFNGSGTVSITANDVFVKGINVLDKPFTIATNLNLLKVENCSGGDNSFVGGISGETASGVFINCTGGDNSFAGGDNGQIASGVFINCIGGDNSFAGSNNGGYASGTFTNCVGGNRAFGAGASGLFNNCTGGNNSFGPYAGSGTFTNCIGGNNSFGSLSLSGKLYHCRLTLGIFATVLGGGRTYYCVDGNGNTNNQ